MSFFFSIMFFAYGAAIFKGKDYVFDHIKSECQRPLGSFGDFDRVHRIAEVFACTEECPCNANPEDFPLEIASSMVVDNENGITQIQQCQAYQDYVELEAVQLDRTITILETHLDCSGACFNSQFRSFTNITLGPPEQHCLRALEIYVLDYGEILAAGCIAIGALLLLGVLGSLIIICCISTKRKQKEVTLYKYDMIESNII